MNRSCVSIVPAALLAVALFCTVAPRAQASEQGSIFARNELSADVALEGDAFHLPTVFGPTGLTGWILDGELVVREVAKDSPSAGRVLPEDRIFGVNGRPFADDPLAMLGDAIVTAEKTGRLVLDVMRGPHERSVTLRLRKMPSLGGDWPFDCRKSDRILAEAVRFLAESQHPDGGFDTQTRVVYGTIGLAWLAADDPVYIENCRRLIRWYDATGQIDDPDNACWGWGYFGTFLGEYYLKTGDRSVLKLCEAVSERIAASQYRCGGWGHGPVAPGEQEGYGYVAGGLMNSAGVACWLALELFDECNVKRPEALSKARKYFMRFVDNGTIPYGDHHPEFNTTGNSKDALACLALAVKGDAEAAGLMGRLCTDFYKARHHGHTGGFLGFMWGNVAGSHNPHHPDYRRMLDHWDSILHVARRWDGAFLMPESVTGWQYLREGPLFNTAGIALMYGVPRKGLRIYGHPKSVFGANKQLPPDVKRGLELYADLAFDEIRKTVSSETEAGRQLRRAAETRKTDLALSLKKARQALKNGNPVLAERIASSLDAMCGGRLPSCRDIVREASSDRNKFILESARLYETHRWLIYNHPESLRVIEGIAASRDAGVYATLARDLLSVSADDTRWQHSAALLFARYFGRPDPLSMAGMQRLSGMKGTGWLRWVPLNWMREQGYVKDEFLHDWQSLVPAAGAPGDTRRQAAVWNCFFETPAEGWMDPDFDDSLWRKAKGPMSDAADAELKPDNAAAYHSIRIPFDVASTDIGTWRLWVKNAGRSTRAAVYLNGSCIAWIDPWRDEYLSVDLKPEARRFLKLGRNVLAVRLSNPRKFDIGLYAESATPEQRAQK